MAVTVSPVVQNDWISLLPDEILHCILGRLQTSQQAAQTSTLSRRWQSLWQSYPDVKFYSGSCNTLLSDTDNLQSFVSATIRRFSRDSLQRVEKMNLYVAGDHDTADPLVAELLNLASNRKAQEVCMIPSSRLSGYLGLPLESLSNSSLRSLMLGHVALYRSLDLSNLKLTDKDCCECDDDLLSLNSLRSLHLWKVVITDERVLTDLFRSSPLLETLTLGRIAGMKKIRVSKVAKLRTLTISCSSYNPDLVEVEEIEIVAPGLETLHLDHIRTVFRIDVTAPKLSHLEIGYYHGLSLGYIAAMISTNFPSLKSLKLYTYPCEWKLLTGPELVKFLLLPELYH